MSQEKTKDQEQTELLAALEKSASDSAWILSTCLEKNAEYFKLRPDLLAKLSERLERGLELAKAGNFRAASVLQRHGIDLVLQENHSVFKDSPSLRKALLRYRDHDLKVIAPLMERQKK